MSIFGDIMSAIFGRSASAAAPSTSAAPSTAAAPSASAAPQAQAAPSGTAAAKPATQAKVDVAAVLDGLAKQKKQKLNWRTSIVDLMKLLDLDSSATARKHLAEELHYQGDMKKSDERLAAQAGDDQARRKWWEGPRRIEALRRK